MQKSAARGNAASRIRSERLLPIRPWRPDRQGQSRRMARTRGGWPAFPMPKSNTASCCSTAKASPSTRQRAAKLFRQAAEQGNPVAQNRLPRLYANGVVVKDDPVQAAKWHLLARERRRQRLHPRSHAGQAHQGAARRGRESTPKTGATAASRSESAHLDSGRGLSVLKGGDSEIIPFKAFHENQWQRDSPRQRDRAQGRRCGSRSRRKP